MQQSLRKKMCGDKRCSGGGGSLLFNGLKM
jgi:hypothetical protein